MNNDLPTVGEKEIGTIMFDDRTLLITGGTGSFGNAVLRRLLSSKLREIRIFSRDEKKQDDMRQRYNSDKLKFFIGDVRDRQSVNAAVRGADFIFHAAALKQVPSCEFHPIEATRTNVLGTGNVLDAAIEHDVKKMICLSTDKAVYPINAMGMSKALMEKTMVSKSRVDSSSKTIICGTRYGNVMASRGSVIPLFVDQIRSNKPITITDGDMTRFMMSLDDAVELVLYAFGHGRPGDIFVQKAPAATLTDLATAIRELLGKPDHPIQTIGARHSEKVYESLLTREEMRVAEDMGDYYRIPADMRDLNYTKYLETRMIIGQDEEYHSHNTNRLDVNGTKELLLKLSFMRAAVEGRYETIDT